MFKGKVIIYKTDPRTGQVYQVVKEFNDPKEYEQFLQQNPEFSMMSNFGDFGPRFSLGEWTALEKWIEELLQKRLGLSYDYSQPSYSQSYTRQPQAGVSTYDELPVDLSRYEFEAKKIEEEKRKLREKLNKFREALYKLETYKKQFEQADNKELLSQIEEDIKKVKEQIKEVEQELAKFEGGSKKKSKSKSKK
jgi:chromosome segregation ATPase